MAHPDHGAARFKSTLPKPMPQIKTDFFARRCNMELSPHRQLGSVQKLLQILARAPPGQPARVLTISIIDNDPSAPQFTSAPPAKAVAGSTFLYRPGAVGNPNPAFTLPGGPHGTSPDPATGTLAWPALAPGIVRADKSLAAPGEMISLPVHLDASGEESQIGFSLEFPSAILEFSRAMPPDPNLPLHSG